MKKPNHNTDFGPGWATYEAVLEDVHFEWMTLEQDSFKKAKNDCKEYLDKILDERYTMKDFHRCLQPTK